MTTTETWFKITAKHEDGDDDDASAEILLYDEIGRNWFGEGISAEELVRTLAELDVAKIDVRINSVGGQVFEGLAIFNALDRHPAEITTHIDGMAASIASIVALAGDEVRIAENAFMMIHNPWGVAIGDANEMRSMAEILDKLGGSLADIYAAKTGGKHNAMRKLMDAETWFNATEALEAKLVDTIAPAMAIAASVFDMTKFQNVPSSLSDRLEPATNPHGGPSRSSDAELVRLQRLEAVAVELEDIVADAEKAEVLQVAAESERILSLTLL